MYLHALSRGSDGYAPRLPFESPDPAGHRPAPITSHGTERPSAIRRRFYTQPRPSRSGGSRIGIGRRRDGTAAPEQNMNKWVKAGACALIGAMALGLSARWAVRAWQPPESRGAEPALEPAPYPEAMKRYLAEWEGPAVEWKSEAELPEGLAWENGADLPDRGDPCALKGGILRLWNNGPSPSTFRTFGPNSRQFFRYYMYDTVQIKLVELHSAAMKPMPGLAESWAVAPDGRTVYFRLDPTARYSNGRPVRAGDFAFAWYVHCHPHAQDPLAVLSLRRRAGKLTIYGERALSLTLPSSKPLAPYLAALQLPAEEPGFYSEYGSDFPTRYQWRAAPTTGAYEVKPELVQRGRRITLLRVKNWWAGDKPFYRHTANVDAIEHHFLPDEAQAWELFLKNELDIMLVRKTAPWQDKLETPEVRRGLIEKHTFYARYPMPPYGIYLNTGMQPTDDLNVRLGIQHALDMSGAVAAISRGTGERKRGYSEGYGPWSLPGLEERRYEPDKARAYFHRAGYTETGEDGILRKPDGTRLSVALTYSDTSPQTARMIAWLKQYARPCGLEIVQDCLDVSVSVSKVRNKRHQAAYWASVLPYPLPDHYESFHSAFARTESENITATADAAMDAALEAEYRASTPEDLQQATWTVQQRIHDMAAFVPGWKENCVRIANWRYVRFPDTPDTPFSTPYPYDVQEAHLYWIDPTLREATRRVLRTGESFPEVDAVHDAYK